MLSFAKILQLHDIALDYLPEMRERRLSLKPAHVSRSSLLNYFTSLAAASHYVLESRTTAIEWAARDLLSAVCFYGGNYTRGFVLELDEEDKTEIHRQHRKNYKSFYWKWFLMQ